MQNSDSHFFGPNPSTPYPFPEFPRIGFLKNFIQSTLIEVGDYTYYDDPDGPEHFEKKNVLYHYDFRGDKLLIGKFCAIATGVKFIMNGAIIRRVHSLHFLSQFFQTDGKNPCLNLEIFRIKEIRL